MNTCDNVVKILGHRNLTHTNHKTNQKQKVGCIVLEFISGETLANTDILNLTTKEKLKIVKKLLSMYSAPDVHMHSQKATEQSDLYSNGFL